MENKVKYADILLYLNCNYNCYYCCEKVIRKNEDMGRVATKEGMERIASFFDNRGHWKIALIGGEPTLHPYFLELCELLTRNHNIIFTTNLSWDISTIKNYVCKINASKVNIYSSLQPQGETNFTLFYEKTKILKEAGFNITITYVVTPERIHFIQKYFDIFKGIEIPFVVLALLGNVGGKQYPEDYTEKEKEIIRTYAIHKYTLQSLDFKMQIFSYKKICSAGFDRIYIDARTGDIFPCQSMCSINENEFYLYKIGNIYDDDLKLLKQPLPCPVQICRCDLFDELNDFTEKNIQKNFLNFKPIHANEWNKFKKIAYEGYIERLGLYNISRQEKAIKFINSLFDENIPSILIYTASTHTEKLLSIIKEQGLGKNVIAIVDKDPNKWERNKWNKGIPARRHRKI